MYLALSPRALFEKLGLVSEPQYPPFRTFAASFTSSSISDVPLRMLEPGLSISFELTEKQGAALVTKYPTYREDAELELPFKAYTKRHYDSWVAFARDAGHGDDITPVIVTGVDMTRDFAMMAYGNSSVSLASEFTTSVAMVASTSISAWGTWRTEGLVHTNCGPQLCRPPSSTPVTDLTPPGDNGAETVPDEYNQCVFVRYYTMRKRLMFPAVIRAAAGPHDLGSGGRDDEALPEVEVQSDPDSNSDTMSSLWDVDRDDDRSSVTSIGSESGIVVHNTTPVWPSLHLPSDSNYPLQDEVDDFDAIANYVFQASSRCDYRRKCREASNPPSLELRRRVGTLPSSRYCAASRGGSRSCVKHQPLSISQPGSDATIPSLLFEKRPPITVDESGGLFLQLSGHPGAHVLTSGDDRDSQRN